MRIRRSACFALLVALIGVGTTRAQTLLGTAFTYQGRLTDAGVPPSGPYDLQFRLFDAPTAGGLVGSTVTLPSVAVTAGLFTVRLDFGASAFAGSARWLEVGVKSAGSPNSFTVLSPRQELTPVPDAVFSATAPWTGVTGKPAGLADGVDNDSGGDITGVSAGTGLNGGGSSGDVSLAVNTAIIQSRVTGTCAPGSSIRVVNDVGTVACQPDTTGNDWGLAGNAGTTPGTNFIGTTDNQAFELRVNTLRALRLEPDETSPNVIGGFNGNTATTGVRGAFIGGGGATALPNLVTDQFSVVGGGIGNRAGDGAGSTLDHGHATVGGGDSNTASGKISTVAGGLRNTASGFIATIGGGEQNRASNYDSTVGGGAVNTASGVGSTIAGGAGNVAGGDYSFAAGANARVRDAATVGDSDGDEGTFVWADRSGSNFQSTGPNQFLIRSAGGVGINTNTPAVGTALTVSGNTAVTGNVGVGTTAPGSKLHVAGGSVYISAPNSLIITSPNGNCWFITVSDAGALSSFQVACP